MPPIFAIWEDSTNWGDAINRVLIETLSQRRAINVSPYLNKSKRLYSHPKNLIRALMGEPTYMAVGSILAWANRDTVVWGPGFISEDERLKEEPGKILAVRGPLSRDIIISQGVDCPESYGDPALLFPRIYPRKPEPKYALGIVPHFVDYRQALLRYGAKEGVRVIDIKAGIFSVVDQVLECERVVSSCLHGLVIADAYSIPSLWLKFSDNVIGQGFKFRDYYASLNRWGVEPFIVGEDTYLSDVLEAFGPPHSVPSKLLDGLWDVCTFKTCSEESRE